MHCVSSAVATKNRCDGRDLPGTGDSFAHAWPAMFHVNEVMCERTILLLLLPPPPPPLPLLLPPLPPPHVVEVITKHQFQLSRTVEDLLYYIYHYSNAAVFIQAFLRIVRR